MFEIEMNSPIYQRGAWISITASFVLVIAGGLISSLALSDILPSGSKAILNLCTNFFSLLLPVIYLSVRYGPLKMTEFRMRGPDVAVLLAAFAVLTIVISAASLQGPYGPYTHSGQEISKLSRFEYSIALLSIFLVLPFLEETLFRRYIFEIFRSKYKIPIAILLTVLGDTLLHLGGGLEDLAYIFVGEIFFTFVYFKSRLGVSIIVHCLTNVSLYFM